MKPFTHISDAQAVKDDIKDKDVEKLAKKPLKELLQMCQQDIGGSNRPVCLWGKGNKWSAVKFSPSNYYIVDAIPPKAITFDESPERVLARLYLEQVAYYNT